MGWLLWLVIWCAFLFVSATILPTLYPGASAEELQLARTMKTVSFFGLLVCAIITAFYAVEQRAMWERMAQRNPAAPTQLSWERVVSRANRGRTVRLADLTEAQDPVSMDSFEEGDRIALLPAGTRRTPFHLNSVRRMRDTHPFSHPMTRQRMRNENIEVVRIAKEKKTK